jgi:hypothetical protein
MSDKVNTAEKTEVQKPSAVLNQELWKQIGAIATRDQTDDPTQNKQQTLHGLAEALKSNWYGLDSDKNGHVTLPEIEFFEKHRAPDSQTRQALSFFRENGGLMSQYATDRGGIGASQAHLGISEADRKVFDIITDPNKQRITLAAKELSRPHLWLDVPLAAGAGAGLGALAPAGARRLLASGWMAETGALGKTLATVGARSPYVGLAIGERLCKGLQQQAIRFVQTHSSNP